MALYELRTYTLRVGAMAEAVKLYQELGFPALQRGGCDKKLIDTFRPIPARSTNSSICGNSMTMAIGARIGRRYSPVRDFVEGFAAKFRPLVMTQEVKLLQAAPWGPHP